MDPYMQAKQEYANGSYDNAVKLFNTSLQIRNKNNGPNSVLVANVLTNLGAIKIQFGSYDQAVEYYQKAESAYLREGENKLRQLASVQANLAICFNNKGDFEKAMTYYENAIRIYRTLKLENSSDYEGLLINQTQLFLDYNKLANAEELNNQDFKLITPGKNNFVKWNLKGFISYKKKLYNESIACFEKALKVGKADLGENFIQEGLIFMNIGLVYLDMEDFENSMANYKIAMDLFEKTGGNQGVSYSSCMKDMGLNFLMKKENESNLEKFLVQRKKNIEIALGYFQKAIIAVTPGFTSVDFSINPDPQNAVDKTKLLDAMKNKADALYLLAQLEEKEVRASASKMIALVIEAGYEEYLEENYANYRSRVEDLEQLAVFARQFATLEDFLTQMRRMRKIGSLESILKMVPGMGGMVKKMGDMQVPEKEIDKTEAIISSMTKKERQEPSIINASRRARIAKGCGMTVGEVNALLKNFEQMNKMMQQMLGGGGKQPKMPKIPGMPAGYTPPGSKPQPRSAMQNSMAPGLGMPDMGGMGDMGGGEAKKGLSKKTLAERKKKKMNKKQRKKR